jgi:hypothetical protein
MSRNPDFRTAVGLQPATAAAKLFAPGTFTGATPASSRKKAFFSAVDWTME